MALQINTNLGALMASASASSVNRAMETSMERLSTGKRINTAADDAAGMAISSRMESQIRGLNQAIRNAADGQALIDTTEGAHNEVTNILQRMRELAVQSANDTNVASDRANLQAEVTQLIAEVDRIASQTTWNGVAVLDGSFTGKQLQIGADSSQILTFSVDGTKSTDLKQHYIDTDALLAKGGVAGGNVNGSTATVFVVAGGTGTTTVTTTAGSTTAKDIAASVNADTATTGVKASAVTKAKFTLSAADTVSFSVNGYAINTTSVASAGNLTALRDAVNAVSGSSGVTASLSDSATVILTAADGSDIDISGYTATGTATMGLVALNQDGAVAGAGTAVTIAKTTAGTTDWGTVSGQVRLSSSSAFTVSETTNGNYLATTTVSSNTVSAIDISSVAGSASAIDVLDASINKINSARANLGAISNRLDNTISNLTNIVTNVSSSQSRIQDADFAAESTNLAKSQILQQAATAMLAQANASKQGVLSLLQR